MRCMVWGIFLLVVSHPSAFARAVPASQPIAVKLEPSQPTAVALPEPIVSVSVGIAPERLSLDYDGPYLFLLPLDPTVTGRLFIVGQSGTLYTLLFKVASPADEVVHVTAASSPQSGTTVPPFGVASFLRALRTGKAVPGQQSVDIAPPAFPDTRLQLTNTAVLGVGALLGMVLTVKNTQGNALTLDVRIGESGAGGNDTLVALTTWTWPPRLTIKGVAADEETLAPGAETRIYVILERRP